MNEHDYESEDKRVVEALKRNSSLTTAPENSCGCAHCAMRDMMTVSENDFKFYTGHFEKILHGEKCSGKGCKHGVTGNHWPIEKNAIGDKIQAYWCKFASNGLCKTFFCVDCAEKKKREDSLNLNNTMIGRCRRKVKK